VKSEKSRFIIHVAFSKPWVVEPFHARRLRVNLGGEFTKITGLGAVLCRHFENSRGFNAPQPESPTRTHRARKRHSTARLRTESETVHSETRYRGISNSTFNNPNLEQLSYIANIVCRPLESACPKYRYHPMRVCLRRLNFILVSPCHHHRLRRHRRQYQGRHPCPPPVRLQLPRPSARRRSPRSRA
jgi:hypothetical protein